MPSHHLLYVLFVLFSQLQVFVDLSILQAAISVIFFVTDADRDDILVT